LIVFTFRSLTLEEQNGKEKTALQQQNRRQEYESKEKAYNLSYIKICMIMCHQMGMSRRKKAEKTF